MGSDAPPNTYRRLAEATVHDLRNALNVMAIHMAVLGQRMDAADGTPARSVVAINGQIARIDGILRRFLALASPPEAEATTDLAELVASSVEACRHVARAQGVAVETDLHRAEVRGRVSALTECVLALLMRGIDAGRGGKLQVSVDRSAGHAVLSLTGRPEGGAQAPRLELQFPSVPGDDPQARAGA